MHDASEAPPPQLPILPGTIKDAVLTELSDIAALVDALTLEDWKKQSAARGWTIGDVVAHLELALALYSRLLDAIVAGHGSGPVWKALGQITKKAAPLGGPLFNSLNTMVSRAVSSALSPETVQGQFAAGCRGLRERLEKVQSNDFTRPAQYMGRPWPLSFFLTAVENELAVHGWDIASQLRPDAHLSSQARDVLPWFYWGATSYMLRRASGLTGVVAADLTDPATAFWWDIAATGPKQHTGTPENPNVTIRGESSTFVLVLAGRIGVDDALRGTSIRTDGDEDLARAFLGAWKIT